MGITYRSIASFVLLSLFTCGIYNIYWFVVTTDDIQATLRAPDGSVDSGGISFLLSLVTCGIYGIYWRYKQGQRIAQIQYEGGMMVSDNSTMFIILSIFGFSIIADAIIQSDINNIIAYQNNLNNGNNNFNGGNYNGGNNNNFNNNGNNNGGNYNGGNNNNFDNNGGNN